MELIGHIRLRPGMYIGKIGDGAEPDHGIYTLLREIVNNSVDEFTDGYGTEIIIDIDDDGHVSIRDFGRGIPFDQMIRMVSSSMGMKCDHKGKSIGLATVGLAVVASLSESSTIVSYREGECQVMCFSRGKLISSERMITTETDGLKVMFKPDSDVFANFAYRMDIVREIIKEYCYLRSGLRIILNGESFIYQNGLRDMISESISSSPLYEPIHICNDDFEIVFTHTDNQEEDIRSYVNGHYTPKGGTHLTAFRKAITKVMSDYFKTKLSVSETCKGIVCAFNVNLSNPYFTGACKFKLYSEHMWEYDDGNAGPSIYNSIKDFLSSMLPELLAGNNSLSNIIKSRSENVWEQSE